MVLMSGRFLTSFGMTDCEGNFRGGSGDSHQYKTLELIQNMRIAAPSPLIIFYSVIPNEADEGGVMRNLQLMNRVLKNVYKE
jgi:hypothetical protein